MPGRNRLVESSDCATLALYDSHILLRLLFTALSGFYTAMFYIKRRTGVLYGKALHKTPNRDLMRKCSRVQHKYPYMDYTRQSAGLCETVVQLWSAFPWCSTSLAVRSLSFSPEYCESEIMEKCPQKNVWLFVHFVNIKCAPNFGKTLLTYMLHAIMHIKSLEESSIVLILYSF